MPFEEAAAFLMTYGTSYYAIKDRGDPKPGEKLLVLGAAGGVGIAAVELGKAMGLEVIAAASSREKVDFCLSRALITASFMNASSTGTARRNSPRTSRPFPGRGRHHL